MGVLYEKKVDDFVNERLRFERRSRRSERNRPPFFTLEVKLHRNALLICKSNLIKFYKFSNKYSVNDWKIL
ncbi:hypothetical protein BKP35_17780 [Anaerobacillus arseniciselenatis]|uniref:Uncharacterized protein n=1 Tax=Anaerobacillus arseniciselenatis TaxID=85682 RepID=A0A1S2L759_9BACI|nr:hypothetical protein BKP35_17780 [Anaerobacillus arseniciselenatis]